MVGVVEILVDQLPVALHVEIQPAGMAQGGEVVGCGAPGEGLPMLLEGRRLAGDVDEDEVVPQRMAHRHQPRRVGAGVAVVAAAAVEMRPCAQPAVQPVGPAVIGAGQQLPVPARRGHHHRAAMAADVVEDADGALAVAQDEQRHAGHLHRAGIALAGDVVAEAGQHPGAREDALVLRLQPVGTGVAAVGKAAALAGGGIEAGQHVVVQDVAGECEAHGRLRCRPAQHRPPPRAEPARPAPGSATA